MWHAVYYNIRPDYHNSYRYLIDRKSVLTCRTYRHILIHGQTSAHRHIQTRKRGHMHTHLYKYTDTLEQTSPFQHSNVTLSSTRQCLEVKSNISCVAVLSNSAEANFTELTHIITVLRATNPCALTPVVSPSRAHYYITAVRITHSWQCYRKIELLVYLRQVSTKFEIHMEFAGNNKLKASTRNRIAKRVFHIVCIVIAYGWLRTGYELRNRFIYHVYTSLGIKSATANFHAFQTTTAPACCVFNSRYLAIAYNSGESSALRAQLPYSQAPVQSYCQLTGAPQLFLK
jgi:hypothetical protein